MTSPRKPCPICRTEADYEPGTSQPRYECPVCGTYRLSERAAHRAYAVARNSMGGPTGELQRGDNQYLISARIREQYEGSRRQEVLIPDFDELLASARPLVGGPLESVDRILEHVNRRAKRVGDSVHIDASTDYPIAYARDEEELENMMDLGVQERLFAFDPARPALRIAPAGWKRLRELAKTAVLSRQAFVAMWFDETMRGAYADGIVPALHATGYQPLRIDLVQHNDKIDDRIIAAIRKSGLLVADFSGHRGGVYFEAGFALGVGIPVIWTCRDTDIDSLHFDTRQYNHIVWREAVDLREQLQNRIGATMPTYPPIA